MDELQRIGASNTSVRSGYSSREVLAVFAKSGFQKTSMADVAEAAGVSRQSIYKKFGTKENCYESTMRNYLTDMYSRIFAALSDDKTPPRQTLLTIFDILIGEAVEIVRHPHGTEVLADSLAMIRTAEEDWRLRFRHRLAVFLTSHNYTTGENAIGVAFALISAAKGLLLEKHSRESFHENMLIIIRTITFQDDVQSSIRIAI